MLQSLREHLQWRTLRIAHVEVVLRKDLSAQFLKIREEMRTKLENLPTGELKAIAPPELFRSLNVNRKDIIDHLVKPKLTFHGSRASSIPSTVKYGFLKPGDPHPDTGQPHAIRCGATYGAGIYSSPNASVAMMYTKMDGTPTDPKDIPGLKLVVCATLMGRTCQVAAVDWRRKEHPFPGADSHSGPSKIEYIVFESAQIVPVYVVHLDWGQNTPAMLEELRIQTAKAIAGVKSRVEYQIDTSFMGPGELQRLKEAESLKVANSSRTDTDLFQEIGL